MTQSITPPGLIGLLTPAPPSLVAALPSAPVDRQEIYYQADATNGVIWHLRYRSASASSFKWEFIGGRPMIASVATREGGVIGTTYGALTTAGPSITVPLAGDYIVRLGATVELDTATGVGAMSFDVGVTGAVDADSLWGLGPNIRTDGSPGPQRNLRTDIEKTGLTASTALVSKYKRVVASAAFFSDRRMWLIPNRVG